MVNFFFCKYLIIQYFVEFCGFHRTNKLYFQPTFCYTVHLKWVFCVMNCDFNDPWSIYCEPYYSCYHIYDLYVHYMYIWQVKRNLLIFAEDLTLFHFLYHKRINQHFLSTLQNLCWVVDEKVLKSIAGDANEFLKFPIFYCFPIKSLNFDKPLNIFWTKIKKQVLRV